MRIYTVHVKETDRKPPDDVKAVALREAFSIWAFLFRWLWAAFNGAWIVAAILFAVELVMGVTMIALGMDEGSVFLLGLVWMVAVGLFARDLKRWELGILGYEFGAAVVAENGDDALRRYFADTARPMANVREADRAAPAFREDTVAPSLAAAGPGTSTVADAPRLTPRQTEIPYDYDPTAPHTVPRTGPRLT